MMNRLFNVFLGVFSLLLVQPALWAQEMRPLGAVTYESIGEIRLDREELARTGSDFDASHSRGVFVGVDRYTSDFGNRPTNLRACVNDAFDLAATFVALGLLEPAGATIVFSGAPTTDAAQAHRRELAAAGATLIDNANRDTITDALERAASTAGAQGILFVTVSAHGYELDGNLFLTPQNFRYMDESPTSIDLANRGISESLINQIMGASPAPRRLAVIDACREARAGLDVGIPQLIASVQGAVTLYAVSSGGLAGDGAVNGEFTGRLLHALTTIDPPEGLAADSNGHVTVGTLLDYLNVPDRTEQDRSILNMPLRVHPAEYRRAGLYREAIDAFAATKNMENRLARGQRLLTDITLVHIEDAFEEWPRDVADLLHQEVMDLLGTAEGRESTANRRRFVASYTQLQQSVAPAAVVTAPAQTPEPTPRGESELDRIQREARERQDRLEAARSALEVVSELEDSEYLDHTQKAEAWAAYRREHEDANHQLAHARERERYWREWTPTPPPYPTPAGPQPGSKTTIDLGGGVSMTLVWIPPGTFTMGSTKAEQDWAVENGLPREFADRESPQTRVTLTEGFWMGETAVTRGQFARFVRETNHRTTAEVEGSAFGLDTSAGQWKSIDGLTWRTPGFDQGDDHPVVCVSWNDAIAFTEWLSRESGLRIGLPTEAQWEYACRAGTTTRYWWGNDPAAGRGRVNGLDEEAQKILAGSGRRWNHTLPFNDGHMYTSPVHAMEANPWGLYDMHGNVWEWTSSWFGNYPGGNQQDYSGAQQGTLRVIRGGSWFNIPQVLRSAHRNRYTPDVRNNILGFRVVSSPPNS
ncbi:MAG: SUMF1/EgtB/PvdO family nonheme iron enzyme [Candidatus Sumerlaeia bacterium]|nr:SUMF1/EgtB/PvdO family nonheme iron enzyme [Candidatus Sumerlaeia bacterium]